jgi:cysteine desulfurase / selenocysteine lyase
MRIAELLTNEELRRTEFPVAAQKIFLGHAGDSPLPRRVAQAVSDYVLQATCGDQEQFIYPQVLTRGREVAGKLMGCKPEEVAFVGPTSLALSFVASGLKFRRSDNILIYFDDYPSNVYPWMALAEQGIEVRLMNIRGLGVIRPMDVIGQVDENTRLVALASCHFVSGYRIDIDAIGKALHDRKILFCVDGIQTLGAFPTPLTHVDMLAADAHKWLLGPCGAGVLYVRDSVQPRVNPPIYGWNNVASPNFVAQEQIQLRSGPHKYEAGTYNLLGLVGMIAGMELLLEVGIDEISGRLLQLRQFLVPALQGKGYTVVNADAAPANASGIVTFHKGTNEDLGALHEKLTQAGVATSFRADRSGKRYIRLSPHFYNTEAELQKVLDLIPA